MINKSGKSILSVSLIVFSILIFSIAYFVLAAQFDPSPVGTYTDSLGFFSLEGVRSVFVLGDLAYTVSSLDNIIGVFNISLHGNPVPVGAGTYPSGYLDGARSIFALGDYAYTVSESNNTLAVWNISAQSDPFLNGTYTDSEGDYSLDMASSVFVLGDYAYTVSYSDSTLAVFNISLHGNPDPIGTYTNSTYLYGARSVFVLDDYAYVVSFISKTLAVFNISGYGNPILVGTYFDDAGDYSLYGASSVFVLGNYAYTVSQVDATLAVFDISAHGNPVPIGTYTSFDYLDYASSVVVSGDYAYTVSEESHTLAVFDISAHTDPVLLGTYTDTVGDYSLYGASSVFVLDNYAYTTSFIDATLAVFNLGDVAPPNVTISSPTNSTYTTTSIDFNITAIDTRSGMDSCWFTINAGTTNYSMTNVSASAFNYTNSSMTQSSHTAKFYCNDTLNNINNTEQVIFYIDSIAPSISLDAPTDHQNLSHGEYTFFKFTATDTNVLDTCQLWHNVTGTWHKNYTWVGPTSGVQNYTNIDLPEGRYKWNVWCNDTFNNSAFSVNNYTFTVDETDPDVTFITANDTSVTALSITIDYNISDTYLKECYFTLRDSDGNVHNYAENASLNCVATSRSISSLYYGTFVLQIWGEDYTGNLNDANLTFTTVYGADPGGGGGAAGAAEPEVILIYENNTYCGDGICQELNDIGLAENYFTCNQDCPGAVGENLDILIAGLTSYCWDKDPNTACLFETFIRGFKGVTPEELANATIYLDGEVCYKGICERISGKTLATNCFKEGLPCFWKSNTAFLVLFLGLAIAVAITFMRVQAPGKVGKVNPYRYIGMRLKKGRSRRRRY